MKAPTFRTEHGHRFCDITPQVSHKDVEHRWAEAGWMKLCFSSISRNIIWTSEFHSVTLSTEISYRDHSFFFLSVLVKCFPLDVFCIFFIRAEGRRVECGISLGLVSSSINKTDSSFKFSNVKLQQFDKEVKLKSFRSPVVWSVAFDLTSAVKHVALRLCLDVH